MFCNPFPDNFCFWKDYKTPFILISHVEYAYKNEIIDMYFDEKYLTVL
jgi:hypothetical protein